MHGSVVRSVIVVLTVLSGLEVEVSGVLALCAGRNKVSRIGVDCKLHVAGKYHIFASGWCDKKSINQVIFCSVCSVGADCFVPMLLRATRIGVSNAQT